MWLKLYGTDHTTGFYLSPSSPPVHIFNYTLLASVAALLLLNRLVSADGDYPIVRGGGLTRLSSALAGITAALFTLENTGWLRLTGHYGTPLKGWALILCGVFGLLAAASFIVSGLFRKQNAILSLCPALWLLILLVSRFNSYATLIPIADNLLIVLFTMFAAVFALAGARTACGLARKDGRNYMISAGLIASFTGLVLAVPNFIVPGASIGDMENLFVLIFSIHAFAAVLNLRRSIAFV